MSEQRNNNTPNTGISLSVAIAIGVALGVALNNLAIGIAIGVALWGGNEFARRSGNGRHER